MNTALRIQLQIPEANLDTHHPKQEACTAKLHFASRAELQIRRTVSDLLATASTLQSVTMITYNLSLTTDHHPSPITNFLSSFHPPHNSPLLP